MSDIPEEWVDAFGVGWHSVPEGEPGDRRRAGLRAVAPLIRADERRRADAEHAMAERLIRADERVRIRHWSANCRFCDTTHHYDDYVGERRAHQRTTGMAPSMGWMCVCGRWCDRIEDWHAHLTGTGETQGEP